MTFVRSLFILVFTRSNSPVAYVSFACRSAIGAQTLRFVARLADTHPLTTSDPGGYASSAFLREQSSRRNMHRDY